MGAAGLAASLALLPSSSAGADTHLMRGSALPRLWAVQVSPGGRGWFNRTLLESVRKNGINALAVRISSLGTKPAATATFDSVRTFAAAEKLYLVAVLPAGSPKTPAARHATSLCSSGRVSWLRCAVVAGSAASAATLAREPDSVRGLVTVYVRSPRGVSALRLPSAGLRRRVLVIASLSGSFDASAWGSAIRKAAATPSLDLGVVPRASTTLRRFAGLLAQTRRTVPGVKTPAPGGRTVMAFDLGWDPTPNMPWSDLTQADLFNLETENGPGLDTGNLNGINIAAWVAAAHAHKVQAMISIGGSDDQHWEYACNDANRAQFVTNLITFAVSHGFDGVDVDIEDALWGGQNPPVPAMTTCIRAIASAAHAAKSRAGKPLLVSADVTTNWMGPWFAPSKSSVDQFNLMTYGDDLGTLDSDVHDTFNQGLPYAKMTVGVDVADGPAPSTGCGSYAAYAKQHGLMGSFVWAAARNIGNTCADDLAAASGG